jgi:undecaprenyl-phosphate 4-deoxy-4-formamido-L-arabinose transferase
MTNQPEHQTASVSIVIPVFDEDDVLEELFRRLYPVVDGLDNRTEVIFVNDGSRDRSGSLLKAQFEERPEVTRVISMRSNAGQHAAIIAGFQRARGDFVITLDADLQNPPEEIPRIVAAMNKGFDYVGSIRETRHDRKWRHLASRLTNRIRERITSIVMTDQGCMLRGYSKEIVKAVAASNESQTFIPALAFLYAINPTEILVKHDERLAGKSKYSLFKLIQLNFDLITSFSVMPLQLISLTGIGISFFSFLLVLYMAARRLIIGPEVEGVFTLFGIAIFMMGLLLFAVGMVGEYIGRMYSQDKNRRRLHIATMLESRQSDWSAAGSDSTSGGGSGQSSQDGVSDGQ